MNKKTEFLGFIRSWYVTFLKSSYRILTCTTMFKFSGVLVLKTVITFQDTKGSWGNEDCG